MKDFKFSDDERCVLYGYLFDDNQLDDIETIIQSRADAVNPTPSVPSQDGAEEIVTRILYQNSIDSATHLMIQFEKVSDVVKLIAASVCADKDREILHLNDVIKSAQEDIERLKIDVQIYRSSLGYPVPESTPFILTDGTPVFNGIANSLESELTEAKRRIAELERDLEFIKLA